jgi:hypothetical protein
VFGKNLASETYTIDYISVVGGLADSVYVYNKIIAKIDELKLKYHIKGNCEIITNNEKSLAIVKGGKEFIKFQL